MSIMYVAQACVAVFVLLFACMCCMPTASDTPNLPTRMDDDADVLEEIRCA